MSKFSENREDQVAAKPGPRWLWMGVALVVVAGAWASYYFLYYQKVHNLDGFAKCLKTKGARMYGAWWCPHCEEQKEMFNYAFRFVNYTECSAEGQHAMNDTCKQAGIKGYPTWQFADGSRVEGPQPLDVLSQKTGCKLP
jgi:hypothetical protein